ncbi:MAG: hypothetical protein ACK5AL_06170 [Planctomycetota bacterium]|jgi:hypothetical protein
MASIAGAFAKAAKTRWHGSAFSTARKQMRARTDDGLPVVATAQRHRDADELLRCRTGPHVRYERVASSSDWWS